MGTFCAVWVSVFRYLGFVLTHGLIPMVFCLFFGVNHQAPAVEITMNFMKNYSANPDIDPKGSKLVAMMNSLASYYEDIFEQQLDYNVVIWFRYDDGISTLAQYSSLKSSNDSYQFEGLIRVKPRSDWYIDSTPFDNSEYDMHQVFYSDLSASAQSSRFNGDVPDLLEVEYVGSRNSSAPPEANNAYDLWSVLMHEMGHGMGIIGPYNSNDVGDGDYDFNDVLVWGHDMAANCYSNTDKNHLKAEALMDPSTGKNIRHLPAMIDILSMVDGAEWDTSTIDLKRKDFYSASSSADFNTTANWAGNRIPDRDDEAFIRHGRTVTLSTDALVKDLTISGTSTLALTGYQLVALNQVQIGTSSTDTGILDVGAGDAILKYLTVSANSSVTLNGGVLYFPAGTVNQDGTIRGTGTIQIYNTFELGGFLRAQGGDLVVEAKASKLPTIDLDYTVYAQVVAESGDVVFKTPINESGAAIMQIYDGHAIVFNHPWTLSSSGKVYLHSNTMTTKIAGSEATIDGLLYTIGDNCHMDCPVILGSQAEIAFSDSTLTLTGDAQIQAGAHCYGSGTLVANSSLVCHDGTVIDVDVNAASQITLGTTIGDVTINGDLQLESTAEWIADMGEDGTGQLASDHLSVYGGVNLGGATLVLSLLNDFTPVVGDQFDLFDWSGTLLGTFGEITLPDGYAFDLSNLYTNGTVTFLATVSQIPGDANRDGKVDGSDVTILANNWQAGVSDPNPTRITWEMGDFNGDGKIDGSDVTILANNWQHGVTSPVASVPEPSMPVLFGMGVLGFLASICHRRREK